MEPPNKCDKFVRLTEGVSVMLDRAFKLLLYVGSLKRVCLCMHICMYVCMYVCMYACLYVYICMCVCIF